MAKYINPFTDFGFKLIFGTEKSKPFLISFLNSVLSNEPNFSPIVDIEYKDKENSGDAIIERGAIYDILCTTDAGHHFIVEMQNARQQYFINRAIFYLSRAITRQAEKGKKRWDFDLKPVYVISLLNFHLFDLGTAVRTDAALCDLDTKELLSDKIRFVFIQLPNFKIEVPDDCVNNFDRWIFTLNNMETMEEMPFAKENAVFANLEDIVEYANLTQEARDRYDADLQVYRDVTNQIDYARIEGREEGREEGLAEGMAKGMAEGRAEGETKKAMEIAKAMLLAGIDKDQIVTLTGISRAEVDSLI